MNFGGNLPMGLLTTGGNFAFQNGLSLTEHLNNSLKQLKRLMK